MTLRLPLFLAAALALSALMLSPGCQVFTADDDSGADGIATASGRTASESTLADVIARNSVSGAMIAVPTLTVVNDDPLQFMGLVEARVAEKLGQPDLIRRDSGVEVRQFQGGACTLDLFLYPQGQDGTLAVKHVELRGASLDSMARRTCLAELIRNRTLAG